MILKNGLPPICNDVITIYNKVNSKDDNDRTITLWKRFIIHNISFYFENAIKLNGVTLVHEGIYKAIIPLSECYIPLSLFNQNSSGFTINTGDVIVRGAVKDEIKDVAGSRISDLLNKYKGNCFTIKNVIDNTKNLPVGKHFYITGA